jgi:hypothetical protein
VSEDVSIFLGHERGHDIACTIQITNELRLGDATEGRRDDPINGVLVESLPIADDHQWVIYPPRDPFGTGRSGTASTGATPSE